MNFWLQFQHLTWSCINLTLFLAGKANTIESFKWCTYNITWHFWAKIVIFAFFDLGINSINLVDLETLAKMVGGRDGEAPTIVDERIDCIRDLTLKSLRLKPDKWDRMYISDEQRHFINSFVDKDEPIVKTIAYNFNRHINDGSFKKKCQCNFSMSRIIFLKKISFKNYNSFGEYFWNILFSEIMPNFCQLGIMSIHKIQ